MKSDERSLKGDGKLITRGGLGQRISDFVTLNTNIVRNLKKLNIKIFLAKGEKNEFDA